METPMALELLVLTAIILWCRYKEEPMRIHTAVWPLVIVLVCASNARARELPSQVDLRAAYCAAVLKESQSEFTRSLGSVMDPEMKAIVEQRLATIATDFRRLQRYLLPRLPYLDPDGLTAAIQSGQEDVVQRSAHQKMCAAQCQKVLNKYHDVTKAKVCLVTCNEESPAWKRAWVCEDLSWLPF
jgi:hypothetical protein